MIWSSPRLVKAKSSIPVRPVAVTWAVAGALSGEDRDADDGALVEVGGPDRPVVDLQAVGAEESGGGQCRVAGPGGGGAAGGGHTPDGSEGGVGDIQRAGAGVQGQTVGQAGGGQCGDALRSATRPQAPYAGQVRGAGGVEEVQGAVVGSDDAGSQREAQGRGAHAAVGGCGQGGQDSDVTAAGDRGDLTGLGEGDVSGAVRGQRDVLRCPAPGQVEVDGGTRVVERRRGGGCRGRSGHRDRDRSGGQDHGLGELGEHGVPSLLFGHAEAARLRMGWMVAPPGPARGHVRADRREGCGVSRCRDGCPNGRGRSGRRPGRGGPGRLARVSLPRRWQPRCWAPAPGSKSAA